MYKNAVVSIVLLMRDFTILRFFLFYGDESDDIIAIFLNFIIQ